MYHSIIFSTPDGSITRNTWEDWYLIPTSRPVFSPPVIKQTTVELPGRDGHLDISEIVTGYPTFSNRSGSIEFLVDNGHAEWFEIYTMVSDFLNGKMLKAVLEDDPDYYYEGRFIVEGWASSKNNSTITFKYDVSPYKKNCELNVSENSITLSDKYSELTFNVNENISGQYGLDVTGAMPVVPTIICTPDDDQTMSYRFVNEGLSIDTGYIELNGSVINPDVIMYNKYPFPASKCLFYFRGTGVATVRWQRGEM